MTDRGSMLIQAVSRRDRPLAKIQRRDALSTGANFRVVHVLVINRHGDLLLQQIATDHDRHPGMWGSSVAGYVRAGESYAAAAARKLRDELGVKDRPTLLGKTVMQDEQSLKFISVFCLRSDGPFSPNPADFAALKFEPLRRLLIDQSYVLRTPLTPTLVHVLQALSFANGEIALSSDR